MTHTQTPQRAGATSGRSSSSDDSVRQLLDARPASLRFHFIAHERALEAVALLQPALQVIRRKSRSLFGQLDAALDNVNVAKLANFIKHQARGLQIIAVSLKDQFYTEAEALVGVAKDLSAASSKPFCLDLAKYQQVAA